jgi:hypothetical protein
MKQLQPWWNNFNRDETTSSGMKQLEAGWNFSFSCTFECTFHAPWKMSLSDMSQVSRQETNIQANEVNLILFLIHCAIYMHNVSEICSSASRKLVFLLTRAIKHITRVLGRKTSNFSSLGYIALGQYDVPRLFMQQAAWTNSGHHIARVRCNRRDEKPLVFRPRCVIYITVYIIIGSTNTPPWTIISILKLLY